MTQQIVLFWVVLWGLLFFDNFVLVPSGGDYLKIGRRARLLYEPRLRLKARRRDLVFLNPLNPFDRLVVTSRAIGAVTAGQLRTARKLLRTSLGGVDLLSWLGSGYLVVLVVLAAVSVQFYFGAVLLVLAVAHLVTWAACLLVMLLHRQRLRLTAAKVAGLALEALLVPGYLVNLGKRVWFKQTLDIAALTVGLREIRRMPEDSARELYCLRMTNRLDEIAYELGLLVDGPPVTPCDQPHHGLQAWLSEARKCLTTSLPVAG